MHGENRPRAFKTYNCYVRFIQHLYEFYLGAAARDSLDIDKLKLSGVAADNYIHSYAARALKKRRDAILDGTAPSWENHISAFPEEIPAEFPAEFRHIRNWASVHNSVKRAKRNLTEFYDKYHSIVHIMYFEARSWWGRMSGDFPDLDEITSFSLIIKDTDELPERPT